MEVQNFFSNINAWFFDHGIKIIGVIIIALIVNSVGKKFIEQFVRKAVKLVKRTKKDEIAEKKREDTLIKLFGWILSLAIWGIVALTILSELGINITGILAGAGILGIALGFGAQWMIRDFLAGIFIILENQYRVGDVVCLGDICGGVEEITLRKTVLRDLDGIQHHIPNGEIKKVSNLSKQFSRVHLNIGVAYKEDLDKVIQVLNRVGEEMAEDPRWKDCFLEESITKSKAPKVLGVNDFAESAIIIKMVGRTKPLKQWDVMRELRKRIKIAFDKEGIEIPFPQVSIWPRGKWEK